MQLGLLCCWYVWLIVDYYFSCRSVRQNRGVLQKEEKTTKSWWSGYVAPVPAIVVVVSVVAVPW